MNITADLTDKRDSLWLRGVHQLASMVASLKFKGSTKLINAMTSCLCPLPNEPVLVRTIHGFDMIVNPCFGRGDKALYRTGTKERGTLFVMEKTLRPGDTVIDVGANIGIMTAFAALMVGDSGTVHSFEPVQDVFKSLEANVDLNNFRNVVLHKYALGGGANDALIHVNPQNTGESSLVTMGSCAVKEHVHVESLDNLIESRRIITEGAIRFIKIDVEGFELEVLKGARNVLSKPNAPILCVEYCSARMLPTGDPSEIYLFITEVNEYCVFKLEKGMNREGKLLKIRNRNELPKFDNIFCVLPRHMSTLPESIFKQGI